MMIQRLTFLVCLLCFSQTLTFGQADREFWFVAPEVESSHGDEPIFLRIAAISQNATVTISQPANPSGYSSTQTVTPGTVLSLNLSTFKNQLENRPANTVLNRGLRISSTTPITVYYEIAHPDNPEIFPLKGSSALGLSFFVPGQNTFFNQVGTNAFDIVATENNTTVTIVPSANIVGHAANVAFTVTLNRGETFSCVGTDPSSPVTLGGSKITSNKPIAVTHSDDSIRNGGAWDLIGDQIVPVNVLGTEYIAVKGWATDERIYVVATEDGTTYTLNGGGPTYNLAEGQLLSHIITGNATYLNSNKPVYVLHLSGHGQEVADAVLPPITCTGSNQVSFVRTAGSGTFTIMVTTPLGNEGSFAINGNTTVLPASAFFPITGSPGWVGAKVDLTTAQVPNGSNTITNSSGAFHFSLLNQLAQSSQYGYFSSYSSVNLGENRAVCADNLPLRLDGGFGASSYLWNDGSTNRFFDVTQTGVYTVETSIFNCILYDTVFVTVADPQVNLGGDTAVCQGQTVAFDVSQPNYTYLWQDGSTAATFTATEQQQVSVAILDENGCAATDTVEVIYPLADLQGDTILCAGDTLLLSSNVQPAFATSYTWNTGETGASISITEEGFYWVDIIAEVGCISTDTIFIEFRPLPTVSISADTSLCPDESVNIQATIPNLLNVIWSNGVTTTAQTVSAAGTYIVTLTNDVFCSVKDSVTVDFYPEPFVNLGNDTIVCDGSPIVLVPTVSSPAQYLWSDGSTAARLDVSGAGTYSVAITDANGCPAADTVEVEVRASLVQTLPSDTTICQDIILRLNAYQPSATAYRWTGESAFYEQNDYSDTVFIVTYSGLYSVEMENDCGGITQFIRVHKEDCTCTPFVPDAFTPNNDGVNDGFQVFSSCELRAFDLQVYDRWGNLLFRTDNANDTWRGDFRGQQLPSGVYVYRLQYDAADENGNSQTVVTNGSVTLVR